MMMVLTVTHQKMGIEVASESSPLHQLPKNSSDPSKRKLNRSLISEFTVAARPHVRNLITAPDTFLDY